MVFPNIGDETILATLDDRRGFHTGMSIFHDWQTTKTLWVYQSVKPASLTVEYSSLLQLYSLVQWVSRHDDIDIVTNSGYRATKLIFLVTG
jgi:hypothetical protein